MKNIKEAFGANLRKIRKSRKITIEALAEASGISSRLLSNIEAGDTFISAETLCKISFALNVPLQELFDFKWYDKFIYYDNGKFIKPHLKAVLKKDIYELKSLPTLKNIKIKEKMTLAELTFFLMDFCKNNNSTIYVDFFDNKIRDKIVKYYPDGTFSFLATREELKNYENESKNKKYELAMSKMQEIAINEKSLDYILAAAGALKDKKAREKLRIMLDTIDLLEHE